MALKDYLARFNEIDRLIRLRETGKSDELAQKLGVSRRTVHIYIKVMREMGAPISYDYEKNTYFYIIEGKFNICFQATGEKDKD